MDNIDKNIISKALEVGRELFDSALDECDGTYVGADDNQDFVYKGNIYNINISAYWEKSHHFDYVITGNGFEKSGLLSID